VLGQQALALLTGVLAAATGVMQQFARTATAPLRHYERIGDEFCRHRCAHRPANDAAREEIEHDGNVKPSLRRPDVSEVGHPLAVRRWRSELPVEEVGGQRANSANAIVARQTAPFRPGAQGIVLHQPFDDVQPAAETSFKHIVPDAPGAIGPVADIGDVQKGLASCAPNREVFSRESFLQDQLVERQLGDRLLQPLVLALKSLRRFA